MLYEVITRAVRLAGGERARVRARQVERDAAMRSHLAFGRERVEERPLELVETEIREEPAPFVHGESSFRHTPSDARRAAIARTAGRRAVLRCP